MNIKEEKAKIREKIWNLLEQKNIALFPRPCFDRIPNFKGSALAAKNLRKLAEWKKAKVVFANPDFAQKNARENALKNGKILIMASPRLKKGYLEIRPSNVKGKEDFASTIRGAFKFGKNLKKLPKADLVITGSVAVDKNGNRLGKGLSLGDREISFLELEKIINKNTPIITTVHDIQIVDSVPSEPHDKKVNIIVTPTKIIKVKSIKYSK